MSDTKRKNIESQRFSFDADPKQLKRSRKQTRKRLLVEASRGEETPASSYDYMSSSEASHLSRLMLH